ncbi:ABC transporter ATP-binding protein [Trueperella sp. LYQ143]|uniref:ABC transporter ATP-binding protein n=1 Tax=Trueperella sp. LYQ143 TaxID=3391059 RepID=UPI003983B09F
MMFDSIAVKELRFRYAPKEPVLFDGFSHEFSPGKMTAIVGDSGKGKSTLLYILGLLLTPESGVVTIGAEPVSRLPDRQRSRIRSNRIGFVFQDAALDPHRTILDSVIEPALYAGYKRAEVEEKAQQYLRDFGVTARGNHRPGEISGGQAQRVALCRALMNDPHIILADEPTGNLDSKNSWVVIEALLEASQAGRTVIIVTHDGEVADAAHEVLEL